MSTMVKTTKARRQFYTGIAEVIPYTTPLYFAIATESGLLPVG
jgi:hypothetical protein